MKKSFASTFALAKSEANSENEIEIESENEIDIGKKRIEGVKGEEGEKPRSEGLLLSAFTAAHLFRAGMTPVRRSAFPAVRRPILRRDRPRQSGCPTTSRMRTGRLRLRSKRR